MTGWRSGWLVGPRELAEHAENLAMAMLFGLPGFIQEATITALDLASEAEARARAYCNERQARLAAGIAGIAGLRPLPPEAGMFMLIDVSGTGLTGAQFVHELYAAQRVSVMDGAAFGQATANCVRVCFAADAATLDAACARLRRFCAESLPRPARAT
jgi:aspartate/methionine/tyrosine aminotransferase